MKRRLSVLSLLLLFAISCASGPEPGGLLAPSWEVIPPGIAEALCMRLRMDAIATGPVTIVTTTQPLASTHTVGALANISKRRRKRRELAGAKSVIVNRALPIQLPSGTCEWTPIEVREMPRHEDEMIVELSSPLPNPYENDEAGIFARVSLGGENPSFYWIPLTAQGDTWAAGMPVSLVL